MTSPDTSDLPLVEGAPTVRDRLAQVDGLLAAFDYDGVLSPITDDPARATMSEEVTETLRTLAARENVRVAVVSGRALADLRDRVGLDSIVYAGNHGLELYRDGERTVQPEAVDLRDTIVQVRNELEPAIDDVPGCHIEDKDLTLTVHVRQTPRERTQEVQRAVEDALSDQQDLELSEGKEVLEIRPAVGHDKGTAMSELLAASPSDWLSLYLGDDTTDEDAFEAIQPEGIGIHVGTREDTAAKYRIRSQEQVPAFVSWLTRAPLADPDSEDT